MLKKAISFMTAVMVMASMLINVSAAETSDVPEFTRLLYKMDLTGAKTPSDAGITTPLGTWTIETGSEGKLCLKSADDKASLMVGDSEWQNYKVIINYKMVQNENYALVSPATNGIQYNLLRVSVCPRNVDDATYGQYCKYIYTNPPRYSTGHYLEEYYYEGTPTNTSVRNYSTSADYAIGRNTMQTITTTNYNSGASVKFITSVNDGETNEYSVPSSTASKGQLAVIFEDVVKGYTFEDMGYSVEVYGIEVYGEKPEVVPIVTKSYRGNMYISDFANDADFAATGLTSKAGAWEIADGTEGRKCLKGTLDSSGTASLLMGSDEWTDCDIEVSYKFVQEGSPEISANNLMKTTVYTVSGDTLDSGNFVKYMFRNPAYYSNYFGGYSKNGSAALAILNGFKSGTDESAAIKTNAIQNVHVSDINRWGTGGATIVHSVEYSNGTDAPYTNTVNEWAGTGSGILSGKVGLEFKNVISNDAADPAYVEIYDIKITGTKTFNLAYLNADGTAVTKLAPGAAVTVTGNMSDCTINSKNYEKPAVITAVYDGGVLRNIAMQQAEDSFNYTVNIPSDAESCTLKTFVWGSAEDMYPVFDFIDGFDAQ